LFGLVGCTTPGQVATRLPLHQYKADIEITVDGVKFEGMGVTLLEGPKRITLKSKARFDLLTISSCHRNFTQERIDYKSGWFGTGGQSAGTYTFDYAPTEVEKDGYCPLYIQAFDKNGTAAWGYLAFRTNEFLPARMECNGRGWSFKGISVCQSRHGFEQALTFDRPVKYEASELCKIQAKSDKSFRARAEKGFCYATFTDGKERHRLVLLGYDEVLIRGD
jgi:hypothetical protein